MDDSLCTAAGIPRDAGAIYVALVRGGPAAIAEIARRTSLHRPAVYRALAVLEERALVSTAARGKRARYVAAPIARLRALADEQAEAFDRSVAALEQYSDEGGAHAGIRVLEGASGLRSVLDDLAEQLPKGSVFYRYSSRKPALDAERFVPENYRARRDAKRFEQFVITNAALRAHPHRKRVDCFSKVVPKDEDPFEYNVALLVYGDTVATVDYESETAMVITNPRIARFHARLFRLLFDRL